MNEDPKLILGALRPNGRDADDPAFAEALAAAQRDPQLAEWLRESQEFDRAISGKLRTIAAPEGLRAKILAGVRVSRATPALPRARLWAIAAMLIAMMGVAWFWSARDSGSAAWQRHAHSVVEDVVGARTQLDRESPDSALLVAHLQEQSAPVLPILPDALTARPAIGCKSWEWRGLKFAMVCFHLDGAATAHLVTTYHGGLKGAPPLGHMIHGRSGKWHTATWSEGGLACMLFTDADEATLRALLAAQGAGAPPPRVASR